MTRAVIYARASTAEQDTSTAQQIAAATAYAAQKGYTVAASFADDARSGKTTAGREGLAALLDLVTAKPRAADVVLLWDASRLSRDQDDAAILRAQIRKAGYRVEYVGDSGLNIGGREQRIVEALADYRADAFRADLAKNVLRGMEAALKRGGAWGRPPKGYSVINGRIEPNEDLPRVIEAFRLRAAGHSYRYIHKTLGLFPSKNGYSNALSNPFYVGRMRWAGGELPAPVAPAVDADTWAQAQAVNAKRQHPRRIASEYLLSGLVVCANCGRPMNGTKKNWRGAGEFRRYYRCRRFGDSQSPCRAVRADALEARVISNLIDYFEPKKLAKVYAEWRRRRLAEIKAGQAGGDAARQNLARIDAQITRLTAAIESGGQLPGLLSQLQRREAERAEAAAKLAAPAPKAPPIMDAAELCGRVRALLQAGDPQALRLAVRAVVECVTVGGPDAVTVEMVSPDRLLGL